MTDSQTPGKKGRSKRWPIWIFGYLVLVAVVFGMVSGGDTDDAESAITTTQETTEAAVTTEAPITTDAPSMPAQSSTVPAPTTSEPPDTTTAPTTTFDVEQGRENVRQALISDVEALTDVERVERAAFEDGNIVLVVTGAWMSEDRQDNTHIAIAQGMASVFAEGDPDVHEALYGTSTPGLHIDSTDADGEAPISTRTDFAAIVDLHERRLSSADWFAQSRQ